MIDIKELANILQQDLDSYAQANDILVRFKPNTNYLFYIANNEGEYKPPVRQENSNSVIKYINGVLTVISDDKSGFTLDNLIVTLNTRLDILIPDIDNEITINGTTVRFSDAVIDYINNCFAYNNQFVMSDDGTNYLVAASYSSVVTGVKDIRSAVGNSLTVSMYIDYSIVVQGVSSSLYKLYVGKGANKERVYYSRLDLVRTSSQDSYLKSDDNGITKSSTQGSTLEISIVKPFKFDALDTKLVAYLFNGDKTAFDITIERPTNSRGYEFTSKDYNVVFSDTTKGIEGTDVPSVTCRLVENIDLN